MNRILMLNGSPNQHGCTFTALSEVANALKVHGIDSEIVYLGKKAVQGCVACMYCQKHHRCVFNDQVNELSARLGEFDGIVVGSPVYYAGPTVRYVLSWIVSFFPMATDLKASWPPRWFRAGEAARLRPMNA